jgi:hypothetical protein
VSGTPAGEPDRIDRALAAWFAALDLIGGLKPHQRERFRKAMAAALDAADAAHGEAD